MLAFGGFPTASFWLQNGSVLATLGPYWVHHVCVFLIIVNTNAEIYGVKCIKPLSLLYKLIVQLGQSIQNQNVWCWSINPLSLLLIVQPVIVDYKLIVQPVNPTTGSRCLVALLVKVVVFMLHQGSLSLCTQLVQRILLILPVFLPWKRYSFFIHMAQLHSGFCDSAF